jgi:hypothetical protein
MQKPALRLRVTQAFLVHWFTGLVVHWCRVCEPGSFVKSGGEMNGCPLIAAEGYYFFLDKKVTKTQVRANASRAPCRFLTLFFSILRFAPYPSKKVKPSFPPYARPARSDL